MLVTVAVVDIVLGLSQLTPQTHTMERTEPLAHSHIERRTEIIAGMLEGRSHDGKIESDTSLDKHMVVPGLLSEGVVVAQRTAVVISIDETGKH